VAIRASGIVAFQPVLGSNVVTSQADRLHRNIYNMAIYWRDMMVHPEPERYLAFNNLNEIFAAFLERRLQRLLRLGDHSSVAM
jgi:hypothetical protein